MKINERANADCKGPGSSGYAAICMPEIVAWTKHFEAASWLGKDIALRCLEFHVS